MALSDYMPDFSNPTTGAIFGALGNMLATGGQTTIGYRPSKLNALASLAGAGLIGAGEGAKSAQAYKAADMQNQNSQFDIDYYNQQRKPQTQPAQQSDPAQTDQQVNPVQLPQQQPVAAQTPQVNASSIYGSLAPQTAAPPPPSPAQIAQQQAVPQQAAPQAQQGTQMPFGMSPMVVSSKSAPGRVISSGKWDSNGLPMLPPNYMAKNGSALIAQRTEMLKTGMGYDANGNIVVLPGAVDAQAQLEGAKAGAQFQANAAPLAALKAQVEGDQTRQSQAQKIALENASQKDIQNHANYLEFGDNGMGGHGSLAPAVSGQGVNGGQPVPSQHGTVIPDVTDQTPIPRDANSLKAVVPAWQEKATEINNSIQPAQKAQVQLTAIADAYKATESGAFATNKATVKAALQSAGIDLPDSVFGNPAALQVALHGVQLNTLTDLKAANSRFSQMEFKTISQNSAHPNTQPAANLAFISQDLGTINQQLALANDWRSAQKMGWRNPQDFSASWMDKNPQSQFVNWARTKLGLLKGMK